MRFAKTLAAAAICLAIAGCGDSGAPNAQSEAARKQAAAKDGDLLFEAEIMIGRVEVMQEQTKRGLQVLGVSATPPEPASPEHEPYRRLSDTVKRYNRLREVACSAKFFAGEFCAKPFMPLWYAGRARPDTSADGIKRMAEEMQDTMMPLWDGVCAKAKAKSGDELLCAIE